MMTHVLRLSALAAVICLVGACTDAAPPDAASTLTPTAVPTPRETPTPAPTAEPSATALGPEETVVAWVEAQNVALMTGDADALTDLSSTSCRNCFTTFVEPILRVYGAGGGYETNGWHVVSSTVRTSKEQSSVLDVAVRISGGVTRVSATADPVRYPVDRRILEFRVADGLVSSVEFVS